MSSSEVMELSSCPRVSLQRAACKPADSLRVNVNGTVFSVDKATLAENCEYFRALFQSGMRECQENEVHLHSVGVLGFLVMLHVLDGEFPALSSDQIVEAIESSTYGVWELAHSSALFIRDMYTSLKEHVDTLPNRLIEYVDSLVPSSYMAVCSYPPSTEQMPDFQRTVCYLTKNTKCGGS
ncbi:unnamed protein product [Lampetra planeri]